MKQPSITKTNETTKFLSVYCYRKYSDLIKSVNCLIEPAHVIEMGTQHQGRYVLIGSGEVTTALQLQAEEFVRLKEPHEDLLPAYFKQKNISVDKNVVIVESSKLSVLFETANMILTTSDFQCVEIQRALSDTGLGYALFCNGSDVSVFQDITAAQVTLVGSPSDALKFFY